MSFFEVVSNLIFTVFMVVVLVIALKNYREEKRFRAEILEHMNIKEIKTISVISKTVYEKDGDELVKTTT